MDIVLETGRKCDTDKKIKIFASDRGERITHGELALLINQIAINELRIIDSNPNLERNKHNWWKFVMNRALEDAEKGIDWCQPENLKIIEELKYAPYFVKHTDKLIETINKIKKEVKDENKTSPDNTSPNK